MDAKEKEMIATALRFRITKLWGAIDDSMIFAVKLSDGETGYCCVMGYGGQHYGMSLYRGNEGLGSFLTSIEIGRGYMVDSFKMFTTYDSINCDYENSADSELSAKQKSDVREVAKEEGLKICRPKGYPMAIRYDRGVIRMNLTEREKEDITLALKAGIAVAEKLKGLTIGEIQGLGFQFEGTYPPAKGGKEIPLLIPTADGKFEWSKMITPAITQTGPKTPQFTNEELTGQVKRLLRHGKMKCRVFQMKSAVNFADGFYYPEMMILMDGNDELAPVMCDYETPNSPEELLDCLAETLCAIGWCPLTIEVSDPESKAYLEDFCKKTNIKLKKVARLPEIDHAIQYLESSMGMMF